MGVRYKADYAGTGQLMRSAEMLAMLGEVAGHGAEFARSIAPRDTGEYADSIRVDSTRRGGSHKDRAEAQIIADSDHAAYVEWRDGYHVLERTLAFLEGGSG